MELSSPQKIFFLSLLIATIILSALHIHGFSITQWHETLEGTPAPEVLYGKNRGIRSDDWLLDIPSMLAQTAHTPSFPLINKNIGFGVNMLVPFNLPVARPSWIFKPGTWGFLFGNDFGISWLWWTKYLSLLGGIYLVLWIITQNSLWSILGSLIFLYSPYTQFWSLHNYEPVIHAAWAFSALIFVLFAKKRTTILLSGLFFGWSAVCFAINNIYPPFQVLAGLFFFLLTLAFLIQNGKGVISKEDIPLRGIALALGLLIVLVGITQFYFDARTAIEAISNTTYPGRRVTTGGTFAYFMLFAQNLLISKGQIGDWSQLGNYCEAANFIFFFPVILAYFLIERKNIALKKSLIPIICLLYILFLVVFTYIGFPRWLALVTLLAKTTVNRTQIGMGLAEICLVISILGTLNNEDSQRTKKYLIAFSTVFISAFAYYFVKHINLSHRSLLIVAILIYSFLTYFLVTPKHKTKFLCGFLLLSVIYTGHFNPIVRGGNNYLQNNDFALKIKSLYKSKPEARWVVFGPKGEWVLPNYLRIIGVPSIAGHYVQPPLDLLKHFDPEEKNLATYNQCAFISFDYSKSNTADFSFGFGSGVIRISPMAPAFKELNVTYFIFVGPPPNDVLSNPKFKLVDSFRDKQIYERID